MKIENYNYEIGYFFIYFQSLLQIIDLLTTVTALYFFTEFEEINPIMRFLFNFSPYAFILFKIFGILFLIFCQYFLFRDANKDLKQFVFSYLVCSYMLMAMIKICIGNIWLLFF